MFKSKLSRFVLSFAIIAVIFEAILFCIVGFSDHDVGFWINNVLFLVCVGAIVFTLVRLTNGMNFTNDVILGWPIIRHSVIFFIFTMVVAIAAVTPLVRYITWIPCMVLHIIGLGIYLLLVFSGFMHKGTIEKVEGDIQTKREFSQNLKNRVKIISNNSSGKSYSGTVKKLSDKVQYCEPMSSSSAAGVEEEITQLFDELESFVEKDDAGEVERVCAKLFNKFDERDALCKADGKRQNSKVL